MTPDSPLPSPSPVMPAGTAAQEPPRRRRRWLIWSLVTVAVLVIGYATIVLPILRHGRPAAPGGRYAGPTGPLPVTAATAHSANISIRLVALGTVTPVHTVTVHSLVDGQLQKIYFTEGQEVTAGDPLAEIDPRPFEAQKEQAEAGLARDQSLLANARVDLARYETLLTQDSVAAQQVSTQKALVAQYEATVKLDQALINTASLQLAYAHITAPVTGRVGLRLVDSGNVVRASDSTGIVVITQLRPITVVFSIPQEALPGVLTSFRGKQPLTVEAFDQTGLTKLATGHLISIDNQIDPTTGTVKLRGEFPNTDERLFPNQFVNVQLIFGTMVNATVVPAAAIQRGTAGTYVYLVTDRAGKKTVAVRVVETGPTENGLIAVTKGLAPGDAVVTDGVDKLREGSAVDLITPPEGMPAAKGKTSARTPAESAAWKQAHAKGSTP